MSRSKKLQIHYHEQLTDHKIDNVSIFIQSIVDADVTHGKYARFLIESFLNDQFLEEDLVGGLDSTVGQAVSLFDKHKNKLPIEQRSVYALDKETDEALYQSPGDLWNSVKQFQGELSGKELKKEEQEQIYRETEFVYKDEETGFQIISPLTKESAQWWGKGTRWCTSAEKNNMFKCYASIKPLFILLMPNGDKFQVWKNGNQIQFMDEADKTVSRDYIEQHWNILKPICLWTKILGFTPKKYRTQEICELAVQQNGLALYCVPYEHKTKELCKLAVQKNGKALQYVPEELRTQEICELAVNQDGSVLYFIPEELRTQEICELAVNQDGLALKYIPNKNIYTFFRKSYKTPKLCKLAVQQDSLALGYVPKELKTKELCEIAVQNNGLVLGYVPDRLKTPKICKLAVKNNGNSLFHVPDRLKTPEICELAIQNNGMALEYVLDNLITKNFCELAIEQNGMALQFIPDKYMTKELCKLAVKQNSNALYFIPEELKTQKMHDLAVKKYEDDLKLISKELHKSSINYKKKYQEIYQELKEYFPNNTLSLDSK